MTLAARLGDGSDAEVSALDGERVALVSARAFAPGAPIAIEVATPDGTLALAGKCLGSKRRADGRFDVRARLVSLRREERDRLAALLDDLAR